MSPDVKSFWTFDGTTLAEWTVESRTARTFRVRSNHPHLPEWRQTVMESAIGKKFHLTPDNAMLFAVTDCQREIDQLEARLKLRRSVLGMYESLRASASSRSAPPDHKEE